MEFSRGWTNLVFMNFKLITKHTNASFQNIHIVHAPVWCRRLFIMDKSLFWALKNNINNIYRVYGRQCFHFRLVLADITYSARVQVEHAKSVIATKYPQPITHPAISPFRVRRFVSNIWPMTQTCIIYVYEYLQWFKFLTEHNSITIYMTCPYCHHKAMKYFWRLFIYLLVWQLYV